MSQVVVGENESLENALKRFKRKVQKDGIIADIKKKEEYVKPSVRRKIKSQEARKRAKKEAKINKGF
jgi:small subunit ribosomal protein S21